MNYGYIFCFDILFKICFWDLQNLYDRKGNFYFS